MAGGDMTTHVLGGPFAPRRGVRSTAARRLAVALALIGAGVCALAVIFVVQAAPHDQRVTRAVTELLVVGVPIAGGLYAIGNAHTTRCGVMLLSMGFAWS